MNVSDEQAVRPHVRRVEKPWGWEILWAEEAPHYVGKLLHVDAGKRLSLQYHDEKLETQCLLSGRVLLVVEDAEGALQEIEMERGEGYTIHPFQRHRLVAITDAEVVEVSTPETGTTFRLDDDYARPHETEELRRTLSPANRRATVATK
jgi:quercetin dioxygenase-like cupin family protein